MEGRVTEILEELRRGAAGARDELFRVVYDELKRVASAQLRGQKQQTLQPTALVHEVYLRLVGDKEDVAWNSRGHFFGSAARAMRQILVDLARSRLAQKRGGGRRRITLDSKALGGNDTAETVIAVHDALEKLERLEPQLAQVVEYRFFGGLSFAEAAAAMGVSERTAHYAWKQARAWLLVEIEP